MRTSYSAAIIALTLIVSAGCGGGGGGSQQTQTCIAGQVECGGTCIDPLTDEQYCGASGTCSGAEAGSACASDHSCVAGACVCPSSQVDCGGTCVDPLTDEQHCGASGTCSGASAGSVCASDHFCNAGSCACPTGEVDCGGTCIDPQSNTSHCGAGAGCTGGTTCDPGEYCSQGNCVVSCAANEVVCDNTCVNPNTSNAHCGASGSCLGANAGASCASDHACSGGSCVCSVPGQVDCGGTCIDPLTDEQHCGVSGTCSGGSVCASDHTCNTGTCVCSVSGQVDCGGTCIDPLTDEQHCGASSTCSGSAAGKVCASGQSCLLGVCEPRLDWTPTTSLTAVPHFQDGPTTLIHLVYQDGNLVDTTGHTTWSAVAAPAQTEVGMWSPTQYYTGPFAVADPQPRWVGNSSAKSILDGLTGDFLVCVRFKPGAHPTDTIPSKVLIATGKPENSFGTANGGWALVQRYRGYFFLYRDSTPPTGDLMVGNGFSGTLSTDVNAIAAAEWAYFCAGRDGGAIHSFNEGGQVNETSTFIGDFGAFTGPVGTLQTSPDDPTVGSYADGTHPLFDGGVYEIIVTADRATSGNALNLIAGASGGVVSDWTGLVTVTGADGQPHVGAPSTVVATGGSIPTDHALSWGAPLPSSPPAAGTCYGLVASAADWSALPAGIIALRWQDATGYSQLSWASTVLAGVEDYDAGPPPISGAACANPGTLASGAHTFLACHGTDGHSRAYVDGVQISESAAVLDPSLIPDLADVASTFTLGPIGSGVTVSRVFACGTADPLVCH